MRVHLIFDEMNDACQRGVTVRVLNSAPQFLLTLNPKILLRNPFAQRVRIQRQQLVWPLVGCI